MLERYELLFEAASCQEALARSERAAALTQLRRRPGADGARSSPHARHRHRPPARQDQVPARRLRADAGQLHPAALQRTVEALSGVRLHKQNFRRLVETQGLVEETGEVTTETGGRPARLVRFRREVLLERPAPGCAARAC